MIVLTEQLEGGFSLQLRLVEGQRPGHGARGKFKATWFLIKEGQDYEVSDATAQTIVLSKRVVVSVIEEQKPDKDRFPHPGGL